MIALPRYVRPVTKGNGRRYFYFEKHRGTPHAWPRVTLPADPLSPEFATRIAQCGRLELDGGPLRFRDVSGRTHPLPSPAEGEGGAVFWAAIDKAEDIGKKLAAGERKTFAALIVDFKNSDAYLKDIAPKTREGYDRDIKTIETWSDDPVRALTPEEAQKAIDSYAGMPAAGRAFRATLSRLVAWGIPRGYADVNPVEKTEKPVSDGTYDPWPPWAFELFFDQARVGLHLPVYSGLFTGQRSVDVYKMTRPKAQASEMPIVAQKTGDLIPVQIHSEYRAIIDAAKADHVMLHLREDGEPWTLAGAKTAWQREMNRVELERFRAHRLVFHGLRKNAVCLLLEVGCTEAQVQAIVGMSPAMVAHYAKQVSKFRLARGAMVQLEAGWAAIRANVLGGVKQVG